MSQELQVEEREIQIDYKVPEMEQNNSFEINGRRYYWMSLAEMERNQMIMEKNSDIVSYVKRLVG